jgi:hypothetical protein
MSGRALSRRQLLALLLLATLLAIGLVVKLVL